MTSKFNTSLEILEVADKQLLYQKLIAQLQKDFKLANIPLDFIDGPSPKEVKALLHEKIYFLLMERFPDYLNLLYVVDIPENQIAQVKSNNPVDAAEEMCFLIVKREWQKVWFKHKFSE
ncbi:hypothetical protein [Flagellimonas allohymeniacidonis]|uniref:Uncharacterized protein n=1 Tax=Flagellimonas allohymeniacidonis TaxID=2517819 RepID=A0A4Q8QDC6_9FLAO|nr:hypothetical protein [Allomuricauda hymeniacidonis]TAI47098.1 hypothetical protein EW142_10420 [Allomuricauda hymeniacidonis]